VIVAVSAVISTVDYLVVAIIFPLAFVGFLLILDQKIDARVVVSSDHSTAYIGDAIEFKGSIEIKRGFGLIFIRFPTDPRFELIDGTNVHVIFKGIGVKSSEYSYKLRALRRGIFEFPAVSFSFYPSFGLLDKTETKLPSGISLRILPRIAIPRKGQLRIRSLQELPRQSRARLGPHSTDFATIRDYSVGDPFKFINWKASSRLTDSNKLLINEYEREGLHTFLFILDRSENMRRGTIEDNALEHGIHLVLSFAKVLLSVGINVGVWIVPESTEGRGRRYVLPSSGTTHYNKIKELLLFAESETEVVAWTGDFDRRDPSSKLLLRMVNESTPAIVVITNLSRSNLFQFSHLSQTLLRAKASSVSIIDIMPDSIIAKYSSGGYTSDGVPQGPVLKSLLLPTKKKLYELLPHRVKVVSWDPVKDHPGYIMRKSLSVARSGRRTSVPI
jgi:uncharacterized protein (DUF58 family)